MSIAYQQSRDVRMYIALEIYVSQINKDDKGLKSVTN